MKTINKSFVYRFVSFICFIYIVIYLLASFQFERQIAPLQRNRDAILSQLESRDFSAVSAFRASNTFLLTRQKPILIRPDKIISVFFEVSEVHKVLQAELESLLTVFKSQLFELDLSGLEIQSESFNLSEADFSQSKLIKVHLEGVDFRRANFSGAVLKEARFRSSHFEGALLENADLSNIDMRATVLIQADLRGSNLFYADFTGADLSHSNLSGVKMSGADFREVRFNRANLSRATLGGARLDGADFSEANLHEADLRYADLSQVIGLKQEQLENVIMDHNTSLPEGF